MTSSLNPNPTPGEPDPFDIRNLFTADSNPEIDQSLEGLSPFFRIIGNMHKKMVSCDIPPALAERLLFEWVRGISLGAVFNAPHQHIIVMIPGVPPNE